MNTRFKEIRKEAHLTQQEMADKLSLTRNYIYMMEKGLVEPSSRTIKDICRLFYVNESWLKEGSGAMHYAPTKEEEMADIAYSVMIEENEFVLEVMREVSQMSDKQVDRLLKFLRWMKENDMMKNENDEKKEES